MARNVMSIFVIQRSGVVRGVVSVSPSCHIDQRPFVQQFESGADMNLTVGGYVRPLVRIVALAGQPIVRTLTRSPSLAVPHAVANSVALRSGMMCVDQC